MTATRKTDLVDVMRMIRDARQRGTLTKQQAQTIKGQALHGDPDGAMRGLETILKRRTIANCEEGT